ncbi:MAG: TolC family outer membrane protein [Gammaproteobacteria bacterium]|nr:TolC family outer membrane protein [Gammaproteobacteria bacterium]MCF6258727.1 TolC family outer membrane protein [Gammaproteobacteria bacterium]
MRRFSPRPSQHGFRYCSTLLGFGLAFMLSTAHSESLMDVYNLAAGNDPTIQRATANHAAALEALPQSRANFLPSIDIKASRTESSQNVTKSAFGDGFLGSSNFGTTSYSLNLKLPLYQRNNYVARRLAKHSVTRADAEYETAQQDLQLRVAEAYFDILARRDDLAFARAEKLAIKRQLEQTQQRFDVGLVAITDVHESQARYDLTLAEEILTGNQLDNRIEALRALTGTYHDELDKLNDEITLVRPDPEDIEQWTRTALEQNPALLAAQATLAESRENVAQQRSGHYPTLDLEASSAYNDSGGSRASTSDTNVIGLSFNLPIYAGGRTSSQTRQALYLLDASRQALEEQRRKTQLQVRNAYLGVLSGISRVQALKQALVSNQSALRAAEAGYDVGTRTTVDVLLARRNLFSAQRDYAQSRYDYILNTLRLKQASGSLTADSLQAISNWLH